MLVFLHFSFLPVENPDLKDCIAKTVIYEEKLSPQANAVISGARFMKFNDYDSFIQYDSVKTRFVDPAAKFKKKYIVDFDTVQGRKICNISPKQVENQKTIIYLHGGGYAGNLNKMYYKSIFEPLIAGTGAKLVIPDYGLAPYHTYNETYEMLEKLYRNLTDNISAENIILMGESAGAGLALGFTQWLKINGYTLPSKLLLISPWLDVSLSNPEGNKIDDIILNRKALIEAGILWAGTTDLSHYQLSPINGPLIGLPPLTIFIGGQDMFAPDVMKLSAMMSGQCLAHTVYLYPDMFHVWMMINFMPEAKNAMKQIVDCVDE